MQADFSQLKNKKFIKTVHRENPPLIISLIHNGISSEKNFVKTLGYRFCYRYKIEVGGGIYYPKKYLDREEKILKNLVEKQPSFLENYISKLEKMAKKIFKEIKKTSLKDEFKEFSRRITLLKPVMPYIVSILKIEKILSGKLKAVLKLKDVPAEKINNCLLLISKPFRKDLHLKGEIALLKLANFYIQNDKKLDKINGKIEKFLANYGFINMRWGAGDALSKRTLIERLNEIKNPLAELKKFYQQEFQNKKELNKIINYLKLNKNQLKLISIVQKYAYFRTYRGDIVDIWLYKTLPLLTRIAQRLGLQEDEIKFLTFQEILTKKLPPKKEIEKRKNFKFTAITTPEGFLLTTDKEIIDKLNKILLEQPEKNVAILKGFSANRGYAKGIVRIVKSIRDIGKIHIGDILVSPMTTPNFVPALKKCVAIITDEGGITSHAAIVSRELNKPCIIGTKIATKVLKDGDEVEVDANKGIVRIIKR